MNLLNKKSVLLLGACLGFSQAGFADTNTKTVREGGEFYCATKVCVDISFACWISKITCKPASATNVRITYKSSWIPELGGSAYFFQDQDYQIIGNDYVNSIVLKGRGDDTIRAMDGMDIIVGGAGDDDIDGAGGDDLIYGDAMPLFNNSEGGDDYIAGGSGNDIIYGGLGNDDLVGGDGDDALFGAEGVDSLEGGPGNDLLYGGTVADQYIEGGSGADSFVTHEYDEVSDFNQAEGDTFMNQAPIPEHM